MLMTFTNNFLHFTNNEKQINIFTFLSTYSINSLGISANHGWVLEEEEIELELQQWNQHQITFLNLWTAVADQDAIQIDADVNCANLQYTELCKCRTDYKNATIDSEDEICSNYNEDDLSDNDDKYNIKAYFTSNLCLLYYVYGWEQKGPIGHTS